MPHRTATGTILHRAPGTPGAALSDTGRALAVRAHLARQDLATRLHDGVQRRAQVLRDDGEAGSMTAEYAMVGGVGAAAAGAFITCLKQRDVIEKVLEAAVRALIQSIRSWF
jgi:hypothetical protein